MTAPGLPPVAVTVLTEAIEALPARLRKRLDEATARAADWAVTVAGETYTVAVDEATTVTLTAEAGAVRTPEAARCTCLLAPNCLHRAAVLASAPAEAPDNAAGGPDAPPGTGVEPAGTAVEPAGAATGAGDAVASGAGATAPAGTVEALTPQQVAAVEHLWRAAVAVVEAGATGTGVVARTALLRAAHDAQAAGVYRAAAAARAVATLLRAARDGEPQYRLADLTDTLRDLLVLTHRLRRTGDPGLLGTGRRRYDLAGSLRLYGLCTTPVLADSGYAGVITYLVDRDGTVWAVADLAPGDARRAAGAANATLALGETALTHRAVTRAGLVVSGATASAVRQLGAGSSVRAVSASGVRWADQPCAGLWAQPLAAQVHRAFGALALPAGDRTAGDDLLFLTVTVAGWADDALHAMTDEGAALALRVPADHPAFAYRENLRILGRHPGLSMLVIGRPDPARPATVLPLSVAPTPDATGWALPATLGGHVDLAYDRLHPSHLSEPEPPTSDDHPPTAPHPGTVEEAADTPPGGNPETAATPAGAGEKSDSDPEAAGTLRGSGPVPSNPDPAGGPDPAISDPDAPDQVGESDPAVSDQDAPDPDARDRAGTVDVADPALHLLRRSVERVASGGRTVLTFAAEGRHAADVRQLRRTRLDTGAAVLDLLTTTAATRPRDAFGRLTGDDGTPFAQAWLAAAVYTDAAYRAYAESSWLPTT